MIKSSHCLPRTLKISPNSGTYSSQLEIRTLQSCECIRCHDRSDLILTLDSPVFDTSLAYGNWWLARRQIKVLALLQVPLHGIHQLEIEVHECSSLSKAWNSLLYTTRAELLATVDTEKYTNQWWWFTKEPLEMCIKYWPHQLTTSQDWLCHMAAGSPSN